MEGGNDAHGPYQWHTTAMRRFLIEAYHGIAIALVLFLLADIAAALLISLHHAPKEMPDAYFTSADHAWPPSYFTELYSVRLRWHPYSYWQGRPFAGKYINVGEDGLRHTWNNGFTGTAHGGRTFQIFMFGGSAMWGYGAPDDDTIASALVKILAQTGINARVTNFGQIGYVSTQELALFFQLLRDGKVPDLVIFYDGFNDTASAFQNGVAGITENEINRAREFNAFNMEVPEQRRALYRRAAVTFIRYLAIVGVARSALSRIYPSCIRPTSGSKEGDWIHLLPRSEPIEKTLPKAVVDTYLANARLIAETGGHLGFRSLFYWQPVLYGRRHPSPFEAKKLGVQGEKQFFLKTFLLARAAADDSSIPEGQRPKYLGDSLPEDMPCFFEIAHISGVCNEVVAQRIASDVVKVVGEVAHP
jgi:hypothetical protein